MKYCDKSPEERFHHVQLLTINIYKSTGFGALTFVHFVHKMRACFVPQVLECQQNLEFQPFVAREAYGGAGMQQILVRLLDLSPCADGALPHMIPARTNMAS